MEKENFELDPIWNLEMAEARLNEDIDFLHCIDEEYFNGKKEEYSPYLYWQFRAIMNTLRKSLECNQMYIRRSIDAIYAEKKEGAVNER